MLGILRYLNIANVKPLSLNLGASESFYDIDSLCSKMVLKSKASISLMNDLGSFIGMHVLQLLC